MKIEFFSTVEGVADVYPVQLASQYKPKWVENAKAEYIKRENIPQRQLDLYRCPGIFDLMATGFVVYLPWDITIVTANDGAQVSWNYPSSTLPDLLGYDLVAIHSANGVAKHLPTRSFSIKPIIKFQLPWHVVSLVKMLAIPIPYPDSFEFESVQGILDPAISTEVNPQVRWNVLNGSHTIKAGTPLMQLIPLTDEPVELEVREATERDLKWAKKREYLTNMSYVPKRNIIKEVYKKFFKV